MNKQIAFILAVVVQAAILAAVPARQVYTRLSGRTIRLKTAPVDPYNFLSGYHVILSYEISRPLDWSQTQHRFSRGQVVYVVLKPAEDGTWFAKSIHVQRPQDLNVDALVIKGRYSGWQGITYGIESYYIPEAVREQIEKDLQENARQAIVEVKVDSFGTAALMRIIIEDRVYEY